MSRTNVKMLARQAVLKSIDVRAAHGLDLLSPVDIYALAEAAGAKVRFVDIASMEGMYGRGEAGRVIWLSSLRPLPRRNFSCAHELGHHVFGHGSTVDQLLDESLAAGGGERGLAPFKPEEFLANTFAGYTLMPVLGVRNAFAARGWDAREATPGQVFAVACHFGVGYETLVAHLAYALKAIPTARADELRKTGPKEIREAVLGAPASDALIIADERWASPTLDAEVGTMLLLPAGVKAESDLVVAPQGEHRSGARIYRAVRPGIVRVARLDPAWAVFVRVARYQFAGFAEYRHLEQEDDDE